MITRDYFLRIIHQLAQVLAKVLQLSGEKQFTMALEEVHRSSKQLLGLDLRLLTSLSDSEFIWLFSLGDRFDVEKCIVAAELLRMVGNVRSLEGRESEHLRCHERSLSLFLELLSRETEQLPPEYFDGVQQLVQELPQYSLPVGLRRKLFQYYEYVGRYDQAENLLFNLLEEDPAIAAEGLRFYERLRVKSDEELQKGNLPREEVEKGLNDLRQRLP